MIALLLATALARDAPDAFGRYDVGDVTVVRPVGDAFGTGFANLGRADRSPFDRTVIAALEGRETDYDFVMVFLGQGMPRQIEGALAFNETHNRDVAGTGRSVVADERFGVKSALYMNRTTVWDAYTPDQSRWIFNHEVGHHWLAYVQLETVDPLRETALLGRQVAHWSYFLHTGNSPMEGNSWIDNGDGTFTTEPSSPGPFSRLDLYLMGLVGPEEVEPFFLIEPSDNDGRFPGSRPDHLVTGEEPTTITGTRVDLTIDDIIASNGPITPGPAESPNDFRILTVLAVGPLENVDAADLVRAQALHTLWKAGFLEGTRGLASVTFDVVDEGLTVPPIREPAWIPEAAR